MVYHLIYSPRTTAAHKPTSHKDLLDTSTSDSSSDDSTLRSMSPFSEAFVSSMLQHHREGGSDTAPNGEANDQPRNNVTMTELIARRKQQDLKRSLGKLHVFCSLCLFVNQPNSVVGGQEFKAPEGYLVALSHLVTEYHVPSLIVLLLCTTKSAYSMTHIMCLKL